MPLVTVFSRAARSRRGVAGILVGVAVIGLALSGAFTGQAAQARNALVPGQPVPPSAVSRLDAIAVGFAKENGDARPQWITAVMTTHRRALEAATPGDSEPALASTTVYLVTMKGHFTGYLASVPSGAALPVGSYLSIVVNARTFQLMDWGLSRKASSVAPASLGPVRDLLGRP
jgi:hypothetical protein